MRFDYEISEVKPYINWVYFFHVWGLNGKPQRERDSLREEAERMLAELGQRYQTHAVFRLMQAASDGDDIMVAPRSLGVEECRSVEDNAWFRLPMLRQQHGQRCTCHPQACLCLADFVRPMEWSQEGSLVSSYLGLFATTVDAAMERDYQGDDYLRLLVQTLADRLAEATAERLHERVRRELWGYAKAERLPMADLHRERFQGIRPAVGYPSLPDMSMNFLLDELLDMQQIGIRLTESGMMMPHASVSGLMLAHPEAHYFDIGPIGDDQLQDYARRRGMSIEEMRRYLK